MDFGRDTIEKLESLIDAARCVNVDGKIFSSKNLIPVRDEPRAEGIEVHSLSALCDYIRTNQDNLDLNTLTVLVCSPDEVQLIGPIFGKSRARDCFVTASFSGKQFSFDNFMNQENFAISFRSLMCPKKNDDSEYVLSYVGRIQDRTAVTTDDDGITQTAEIRKGISGHLSEKEKVKPIVKLSPYRTFREIEQPESEFLLRIRPSEDSGFKVALFEADGGAWKLKAMDGIAAYIREKCPEITVLA